MIWLLRLEWLGRTWYLASRSCAPVADGTPLPHTGTLECDGFTEVLDMGGGITGPCSASVAFVLPGIDVQRMVLQGHQLATMTGELSLWSPERTYAQRVPLIRGNLKPSNIPELGELVEGSITQVILEHADGYPDEAAVTDSSTWAALPEDSDGAAYPFPIGNLGAFEKADGTTGYGSAYKIIMLDVTATAEIGLIAGATIGASSVSLYNETDGRTAFNVTTSTDLLGRIVTIVDFTGSSWAPDGTFDIFVVDMQGGIARSNGSGAIEGLGDAALHLLLQRYSSEGPEAVDVGRWVAALPWLNAWDVGFMIEPGTDPIQVITDMLHPMCPALWIMPGPAGIRPVIMADVDPTHALHLQIGRNCDEFPDSPLREIDIDPVTACTVSFAWAERLDRYRGKVTVDRDTDVRAAAGYTRVGSVAMAVEIASYDRGTAALTGSEIIRMAWTRPMTYTVAVPARVALSGRCELGAKVRHTNARRGISERPMYVQGRETDEAGEVWSVTLIGWW